MLALFTSLFLFSSLTQALDLLGRLQWNSICPGFPDIHPAKVVLDDGRHYSANIRKDGHFTIPDIPSGTFVLSVLSHDFRFDQLRIDVDNSNNNTSTSHHPTVHPYVPGTPLAPASPVSLPYPVILSARGKNTYFVEHEAFNLLAMFKNPMMLLMVATAGLMFAMPYLMANMDPETRNQVKETQNQMLSAQNSLQNMDVMGGLQKNLLRTRSDGATNTSNSIAPATAGSASSPSKPATSGGSAKGKSKGRKR